MVANVGQEQDLPLGTDPEVTERSPRVQQPVKKAPWLQRALQRPVWSMVALGVVAFVIEACQQWPEFFFPGHAIGEIIRNLAYALIGAVLFNWILIEIPGERRKRSVYSRNLLALRFLAQMGPLMLAWYRGGARLTGAAEQNPNAWDRSSIERCARSIYERNVENFGSERRQFLAVTVNSIQVALDGMDGASYFFDPDVAVALALYPAKKGLNQLQPPEADDPEPWRRDVHIAWELLQASQRLHEALTTCAPYLELNIEDGSVGLANGVTEPVRLKDLVRGAQSA